MSLRDVAEFFLLRGFEFTHETVRDWEARFAAIFAHQLRAFAVWESWKVMVRRRDICKGEREMVLPVSSY
jgi:transposase-like protein